MKKFFSGLLNKAGEFYEAHLKKRLAACNPVVYYGLIGLTVVIGVLLFLAIVLGMAAVMTLLPGMFIGAFAWLAWTYLELGATYFPFLPKVYQSIPYWHFAFGFAALIAIWRVIRPKKVKEAAVKTRP